MAKAAPKKPAAKAAEKPVRPAEQPEAQPATEHIGTIADRLEGIMAARGMNARQLSQAAGISGDGIRNIVRGKSRNPKKSTLEVIARGLGVSTAFLMGLRGSKPSDPPDSPVPDEAFPAAMPAHQPRVHAQLATPAPVAANAPDAAPDTRQEDPATLRLERILLRLLWESVSAAFDATDEENGKTGCASALREAHRSLRAAQSALGELRILRPEIDWL
jgi:transcriptional regulator with XRE-family HTH domain